MWILFSLLNAIGLSFEGVLQKKSTLHFNEYIITWSILAVSSVIYLPILFFVGFPTHLDTAFWIGVIGRIIVDSFALVLYIKALKDGDISLVIPLMAFMPLFLIFSSIVINHLFPSTLGLIGVAIVIIGLYFLNYDNDTKHILSPILAIKNNRSVRLVLIACFLWSIVVSFQKLSIDNSNVLFYTTFFYPLWAIVFFPVAYLSNRKEFHSIFKKENIIRLAPIGIIDVVQSVAENIALALAIPVYVRSVESTNMIFASVFGLLFFKEKIRSKFIPTLIIVLGIILISFATK